MKNPLENSIQNTQSLKESSAEKAMAVNWKEFWKEQGKVLPSRRDVFPRGEDDGMSDEEIVKALNKHFANEGSDLWHMSGIDSEEFPEIIDKDIRNVCVKLNKLPFLKTREGCGGHEYDRLGGISNIGYSEPYLVFYADEENVEFKKFLEKVAKNIHAYKTSDILGIENVVIGRNQWETHDKRIKEYRVKMEILPTKEWCERNGRKFIEKPEQLNPYYEWCQESGYEYSEDADSESRRKYEESKKIFWKKLEEFGREYGEYFRSEEARRLRDEFFKVFESSS